MNRLKNKTALITGATSGIGKSCAMMLGKMGVNLILTGRRAKKLEELRKELGTEINVTNLCFDVQDYEEVKENLENIIKTHNIDILINNAGLALGLDKIDQGSLEHWETMIDTNVKGLLYISKIILPHMRKRDQGHIINIGSIAGHMTYPNGNVYCATKSAVHAISEAMNIDLVGTKIRVSNIAPGATKTEFSDIRFDGDVSKADTVYDGYKPLAPEDIADLICYTLNTPEHINIQSCTIMPTAQRNPYVLGRH